MKRSLSIFISIVIITSTILEATEFNPQVYKNRKVTAIRLTEPLNIDGILDETVYETQPYSDYVQYVP